jgi:hypothetical protein
MSTASMSAQSLNTQLSTINRFRGVFYQSDRPTKNALEKKWIESSREKTGNATDLELLQKTFDRMK